MEYNPSAFSCFYCNPKYYITEWQFWVLPIYNKLYHLFVIFKYYISSYENKKALSPFYHKNIFERKQMYRMAVLHSFLPKNFYDKMDLRLYFHLTIDKTREFGSATFKGVL